MPGAPELPFSRRLVWFLALWLAGVLAVAAVGLLIRAVLL
jgi:hypothetical protein